MTDENKKGFEQAIDRRGQPRIACDEKVQFDVPSRQGSLGFVKKMNASGCLLVTMERLSVDTEVLIHFILSIADEAMEIEVSGKIVNVDRTVEAPFRGFGIAFSSTNPPQVMRAIQEVVGARLGIAPKAPTPIAPSAPIPRAPADLPPKEKSHPHEDTFPETEIVSSTKSAASRKPAFIIFTIVILLAVGKWMVDAVSSNAWTEELSAIVPIERSKMVDYDLYVFVSPKWLESESRDQKAKLFREFGKAMAKYNIHGAHFVNSEKRVLADVLICDGDATVPPRVSWSDPPQPAIF